jgi:hypothetical protein
MDINIWLSENKNISWLFVPGNCENYIENKLLNLNWKKHIVPNKSKCIVILDDPYQRYIRSILLDFDKINHINNGFCVDNDLIDFLLQNRIIGCGTNSKPQVEFVQYCRDNNLVGDYCFFKLTNILGYQLNHFLHDNGIKNNFNNSIAVDFFNKEKYNQLYNYFNLDINKPYRDKILKHLSKDYDFFNSIQFYAR